MTRKVFSPVIKRLAKFEANILMFFWMKASMTTIAIASRVKRYIVRLMSRELLVRISFLVWGIPEIKNKIPGK